MSDVTNELLQALLSAPEERKAAALKVLKGEAPPPAAVAPEPLLTMAQLAGQFRVNPSTIWRWNPPSHLFGESRRYRLSEVLVYMDSRAFQARAAELREQRRAERAARAAKTPPRVGKLEHGVSQGLDKQEAAS